ncbi:alpha/beta hydrolase [uncultured Rhodoblastus sp.]|uniref:alpha/beta hydrolase n=1 Tax=uncultured Rhodoblastus sp. TaxID=543037 RepID=UPI0025D42C91|nr:alpha/beta hydrolase [uncultured Rhodoblastus sp.]
MNSEEMRVAFNKWRTGLSLLGLSLLPALSGCTTLGMAAAGSDVASTVTDGAARGVGGLFGAPSDASALSTPIFVVSTRKGGSHSTELTPGAQARTSLDFVSVPPGHKAGTIEKPNFGAPNADRHFALVGHSLLDDEEFRAQIAAHVSGRIGVNRDVLVYVHGFNTSMEEARNRLAQIVVDGEFGGVPVLFTWPSKSALLAYGADKESATASRDAYLKLLDELSRTPGVGRVHILAHSMGTWLTMETLRESALAGSPDLRGKLGDVLLASPDIDLTVFKAQLARLDPSHFSIFVSRGDRALQVSAGLQGDRRLGAIDPSSEKDRDMIEKLGVKVYDLSDLSVGLIGHDNYADTPQALRQIGATINAPRAAESGEQAVIDAGADRSVRPPPGAITSEALPPPDAAAAQTAAAPVDAAAPVR